MTPEPREPTTPESPGELPNLPDDPSNPTGPNDIPAGSPDDERRYKDVEENDKAAAGVEITGLAV